MLIRFTSFLSILLFAFFFVACETPVEPVAERPNVVIILADDMGYGDPGAYNPDSKIPTPHMDRLAAEGMRFTDAHSPSGVCTPTRYGLLTGRYSWRTHMKKGVTRGYSPNLIDTTRTTIAKLLKNEGYATGIIGKWHLGIGNEERLDYSKRLSPGPRTHGFDYFFGIAASLDMVPYLFVENEMALELPTDSVGPSGYEYGGPYWRPGPIAPSFKHIDVHPTITTKAVEFIDVHMENAADQPFFLYVPLAAPHTPWLPTENFQGISQAGGYGDFTAEVDWTVGQVIETLERQGIADNTLIIIASDNGSFWIQDDIDRYDHLSNLNLRGIKADIYEGGNRIPFIVRWPEMIEAGTVSDHLVSLVDVMATLADIVDVELPANAGEDSYSILPELLAQEPLTTRQDLIMHSSEGMFAIRKGDWKLIEGLGSGGFTLPKFVEPAPGEPAGQLYNLADDLQETTNLYAERPEIVAELTDLLNQHRDQGFSRIIE
ncbi:MAG: arylsulfatase [Rhodothermales bacterium]